VWLGAKTVASWQFADRSLANHIADVLVCARFPGPGSVRPWRPGRSQIVRGRRPEYTSWRAMQAIRRRPSLPRGGQRGPRCWIPAASAVSRRNCAARRKRVAEDCPDQVADIGHDALPAAGLTQAGGIRCGQRSGCRRLDDAGVDRQQMVKVLSCEMGLYGSGR